MQNLSRMVRHILAAQAPTEPETRESRATHVLEKQLENHVNSEVRGAAFLLRLCSFCEQLGQRLAGAG